jgi:predicted DNA-binding transcriptional regulator AlpA
MRKSKRGGTIPSRRIFPQPMKPVPVEPATPTGPVRILSKQEVMGLVNVKSYITIRTWIKEEGFPPQRVIGPPDGGHRSRIGWIDTEVYAWIANRPRRMPKGSTVQP